MTTAQDSFRFLLSDSVESIAPDSQTQHTGLDSVTELADGYTLISVFKQSVRTDEGEEEHQHPVLFSVVRPAGPLLSLRGHSLKPFRAQRFGQHSTNVPDCSRELHFKRSSPSPLSFDAMAFPQSRRLAQQHRLLRTLERRATSASSFKT